MDPIQPPPRPTGNPMIDALENALRERRREKAAARGTALADEGSILAEFTQTRAKGSSDPEQLLTWDPKSEKGERGLSKLVQSGA